MIREVSVASTALLKQRELLVHHACSSGALELPVDDDDAGYPGLGREISIASSIADATLTFAEVFVLALFGLLVVGITSSASPR